MLLETSHAEGGKQRKSTRTQIRVNSGTRILTFLYEHFTNGSQMAPTIERMANVGIAMRLPCVICGGPKRTLKKKRYTSTSQRATSWKRFWQRALWLIQPCLITTTLQPIKLNTLLIFALFACSPFHQTLFSVEGAEKKREKKKVGRITFFIQMSWGWGLRSLHGCAIVLRRG